MLRTSSASVARSPGAIARGAESCATTAWRTIASLCARPKRSSANTSAVTLSVPSKSGAWDLDHCLALRVQLQRAAVEVDQLDFKFVARHVRQLRRLAVAAIAQLGAFAGGASTMRP